MLTGDAKGGGVALMTPTYNIYNIPNFPVIVVQFKFLSIDFINRLLNFIFLNQIRPKYNYYTQRHFYLNKLINITFQPILFQYYFLPFLFYLLIFLFIIKYVFLVVKRTAMNSFYQY